MRAKDAGCANSERGDYRDGSTLSYTTTDTGLPVTVRRHTGRVCLSAALDYETTDLYEFNVTATDQGHLQTTLKLNDLQYELDI